MNDEPGLFSPTLLKLVFCQLIAVSGTVLVVTLGGIVGTALAADPSWATLPMSLMVVGTALGTVPAVLAMGRFGRRPVFAGGLAVAGGAMLLGVLALNMESFALFCVATALLGFTLAASQQYRFAAAEAVSAERVSQAVSLVLIGSIGGAIIGPELAKLGGGAVASYQTPMLIAVGLYALAVLVVLTMRFPTAAGSQPAAPGGESPLARLLRERVWLAAVAAGVVGQGVMTLIMTATPISMHVMHDFSLADTADVIRNHVLAMYVPSLFSGWLIARLGLGRVLYMGVAIMALTVLIGLQGHAYLHYSGAMIALGVGWNFLFVGGTTLLVRTQTEESRFAGQAANDFAIFGGSALASLAAGVLLYRLGWDVLLLLSLPVVGLLLLLLFLVRRDPRFNG